ncbi:hypothetical protein MIU77_01910 [Mycolicibacillus parakoreensis]|uniref:Lipoprotein LpqE n=1 Tax=Mycolicibacillus parakoreensis TaxID=1069221 RepID=A0ABY3TZK3_9MYCO|nr:hypothetical protein [Mycolicibacillus parakoreensis]ULN53148.1 hypothetical protein MIU77_01910 [Mycolicibacillus parakoreensis]
MKPTTPSPSAVCARPGACTLALATLAALAALLTGCGTGQHSQTAEQAPAVDGSEATTKDVALRDVRIQAQQSGDFLEPGTSVELVLVIANNSLETAEHLVDITTPIGKVTLSPKKPEVPVGGRLLIGTPAGQTNTPKQDDVTNAKATIELSEPITNGLNYDFSFEFDNVGTVKLAVPVSAGLEPQPIPAD